MQFALLSCRNDSREVLPNKVACSKIYCLYFIRCSCAKDGLLLTVKD